MFSVASSSMAPDYEIGDILIVKQTDTRDIKVGDSVSYYGKVGSFKDKVITHKVIKIDKDVDGNLIFHTKGISNLVEDPLVYENQIYGVVVHEAEILSLIYKIINTQYGMFILIIIPIFYIIGSEMLAFLLDNEEKRRGKAIAEEEEPTTKEKKKSKKEKDKE